MYLGRDRDNLHCGVHLRVCHEDSGLRLHPAPQRLPQKFLEHSRLHNCYDRVLLVKNLDISVEAVLFFLWGLGFFFIDDLIFIKTLFPLAQITA